MTIQETITEMRSQGIYCIPLGYNNGKFRHPNEYKHLFDTGGTDEQINDLIHKGLDNGIAVMHAKCNLYLICLDFDEKNAPGINLYLTFCDIVDPYIFKKFVVEKTRSNGYHVYFLSKSLPKFKALASSPTGEEWIACRSAASNCITYCAPSPGYEFIQGCFDDLQFIEEHEMNDVLDAAIQLNKYEGGKSAKGEKLPVLKAPSDIFHVVKEFDRKVPIEWMQDYLESKGWQTDGQIKRKKIDGIAFDFMRYWRPGRDTREVPSANLWMQSKRLSVFTTSTCLPAFDSGEQFSHTASGLLYHYNDKDWKAVMNVILPAADKIQIVLPEVIPMAFSTIANNRVVWRVEVKGIIEWATRCGYKWMAMSNDDDQNKMLIRVVDNVIYESDMSKIQRHYLEEVDANYQDVDANRLLYNFMPSIVKYMDSLPLFDDKLIRDTIDTSFIFFRNGVLKITKDNAQLMRYNEIDGCVFSKHIKNFDYELSSDDGDFGRFLEMISSNTDHLKFIMSSLGYVMHYYKRRDFAKAVMIIENVQDQEEARGRSGKGILAQFVEYIRWTVQQDGRNYKADSQFKMQQIKPGVVVFYLNDPAPNVLMNQFYNLITDDMLIEMKGKKSYTIPYKLSPKILITTNYLPALESDSDKDRFIVLPIEKTFGTNLNVRDVFPGASFFDDEWSRENRNAAINIAVTCIQMYLKFGVMTYQSDEIKRNAELRVVKSLVPECIIEVMENVIDSSIKSTSEIQFLQNLREFDLKRDTSESVKEAFIYRYDGVTIVVNRFYQYCLKAYNLRNFSDKLFTRRLNLYLEKMKIERTDEKKNNYVGKKINIKTDKSNGNYKEIDENNVHF